jgi:transposase
MSGVLRRYEPTGAEGESLSTPLPSVVTGIAWKIRSGAPWRHVPARSGSWKPIYTRSRRWALNATFATMVAATWAAAVPVESWRSDRTGGNVNDCIRFEHAMNAIRVEWRAAAHPT